MKKNISINLQGLIFHIEEDGYEQLRQYLAAIKTYFSNYAGHEEIVADIEGRIAEVFSGKLNPGKQVITQEDVQTLIAQMGSVQDFAQLEEEEDLNQKYSSTQSTSESFNQTTSDNTQSGPIPNQGPKRLFRDETRKVIGGVSAGMANYLGIDPLWIRLVFVLFFLLGIFTAGVSAGFVAFIYVICWIALPKSYTLAEVNAKKLFRDPEDKKLGGVCSGLALYFGMDVGIVRLIFLLSVLFGGLGIPIYIVLWLVVPLATTITDRVQMQGNPVTLSGIEESLKNNLRMRDENGQESGLARILLFPVRLVAQVLEVLSKTLRPFINFLGSAIRIIAGIILLITSLSFIFALFLGLGVGTGLFSEQITQSDFHGPMQLFTRDFPGYGMVAGFLAGFIPSLFLLIIAVGLLTKRFFLKPLAGWSMFAVWVVSLFVMGSAIFVFKQNFNEQGEVITENSYPVTNFQTVLLNARNVNSATEQWLNEFELESTTGSNIRVVQEFRAKGRTEAEAKTNAQMLTYRIQHQDSTLIFDRKARLNENAAFREQQLSLKVFLPENKKFRLNQEFVDMIPNYFDEDYDFNNPVTKRAVWEFRNDKFSCPTCPVKEAPVEDETQNEEDLVDIDINVVDDNLMADWDDYGPEEKTFDFKDFDAITVGGAYHARIKKGDEFSVRARGDQEGISSLKAEQNGSTIEFKSNENFWDFAKNDRSNVLIEITLPTLERVDLSGAVKSEISGFEEDKCRISQSGAVQTSVALNTDELELDLSGAARTTLTGKTNDLRISASGACNVQATNFKAKTADLDLSGASKANIYVTEKLKAGASGVSHISYSGNPANVSSDASGASKIQRKG
ncbi:PspC domain-containing protein [Adhaeribacter radiodurans]|uniref:PspC domain-containing protein n=1 Tax=Adhaeribacter radiodurans TaxID=2745197 RepID=A0A7L7L539_9BACT|nr:PspC domain-containing protein [Adhaeribacter radiodurans]QMU27917.1 PspC domain-containing protein [Adhaeribacter radiodurans]